MVRSGDEMEEQTSRWMMLAMIGSGGELPKVRSYHATRQAPDMEGRNGYATAGQRSHSRRNNANQEVAKITGLALFRLPD